MKREILFRGKSVIESRWIYGYLWIDSVNGLHHIMTDNLNINYAVIHETVGQFTGLTDKNGVKIFEGDIIKYDKHEGYILESFIGEVIFCPESGYGVPYQICFAEIDEFKHDFLNYVIVIGNIYDNHEYLK